MIWNQDSPKTFSEAMDPKSLTHPQLRALLTALANLPDQDLLFWDRRVQAARRRRYADRAADMGGAVWDGAPTGHTKKRSERTTAAGVHR